jgi:hypothetical protein
VIKDGPSEITKIIENTKRKRKNEMEKGKGKGKNS